MWKTKRTCRALEPAAPPMRISCARAGIPTARLGMPRLKGANEKQRSVFSMETSNIAGMKQLTKCLVYAIIDTCTRERGEVMQILLLRGSHRNLAHCHYG